MYNELLNRKNIEAIVVPDIVRQDLLSIIEEKLNKAGLYHRVAYRVKGAESMLTKLRFKRYNMPGSENEHKKMQDLIGIRIMLYYTDDIAIVQELLDSLFSETGVWDTTETNEYEFRAMKINGIFKLPSYLSKTIINPYLSDYIDDTFEIQIRTNSFEGWHEIEHDLRYKGTAFGYGSEALARKMNSILATLELCDDSMVGLLDDLGHRHYKNRSWDDMIRCHYRLKFDNEVLHPLIINVLNEDDDSALAKKLFKFKRPEVIKFLWNDYYDKTGIISTTRVVRIVNQIALKDKRLTEAFAEIDDRNDKVKSNVNQKKKFEPFRKLSSFKVFQANTTIDIRNVGMDEAYRKASNYIYSWLKSRFSDVFDDLPEHIEEFNATLPGYSIKIEYEPEMHIFKQCSSHLDSKISTRVWISEAEIWEEDGELKFVMSNRYAEPEERYRDSDNMLFSRPNFYGEIADNIGICDHSRLRESVKTVDSPESIQKFQELIASPKRHFPLIVFIVKDNSWIEKFDLSYFAHLVGFYAHIRIIKNAEYAESFAEEGCLDMDKYEDSISVFYPGSSKPIVSYKQEILNSNYEVIKFENRKYWNENGCRAYRRQLVAQIREYNVRD